MATEILRPTAAINSVFTNPQNSYDNNTTTAATSTTTNASPAIQVGANGTLATDAWTTKAQTWVSAVCKVEFALTAASNDTVWVYVINSAGTVIHTLLAATSSAVTKQTLQVTLNSSDWGGAGFPNVSQLRVEVGGNKAGGPDGATASLYEVWIEGEYNDTPTFNYTGSGGIAFAGAATTSISTKNYSYSASGGIAFAGTATTSAFIAGVPNEISTLTPIDQPDLYFENSKWYAVVASGTNIRVLSPGSDGTQQFIEKDSTNRPSFGSTIGGYASSTNGTYIDVFMRDDSGTAKNARFDIATESWVDLGGGSRTQTLAISYGSTPGTLTVSCATRSNGDFVVFYDYTDATPTNRYVYANVRDGTTGNWGTEITSGPGGAIGTNDERTPTGGTAVDSSGRVYMIGTGITSRRSYVVAFTASNTWGTEDLIGDFAGSGIAPSFNGCYDSTNNKIHIPVNVDGSNLYGVEFAAADNITETHTLIEAVSSVSAIVMANKPTAIYMNGSNDIYIDEYDSGWQTTDTAVRTGSGTTYGNAIGGAAYDAGNALFGYITYSTTGGIYFDQYELALVFNYVGSGGVEFAGTATSDYATDDSYSASGGVAFAGTATTDYAIDHSYAGSGGIEFAGTATTSITVTFTYAASGGMEFAGVAASDYDTTDSYASSGGVALAGAASFDASADYDYSASGGIEFAGAATADGSADYDYSASGGIEFAGGGVYDNIIAFNYAGSGGIEFAGSATSDYSVVETYAASGGIGFAGTAATDYSRDFPNYSGSGGIEFAGAATTSYTEDVEFTYVASGGFELAGGGIYDYVIDFPNYNGSGGVGFAGAATTESVIDYSYAASGGFALAGVASADYDTTDDYAASGGVEFAGSSAYDYVVDFPNYNGSGGIEFAGAATTNYYETLVFNYVASGGFAVDGTATTDYTKDYDYSASGGAELAGTATSDFTSDFDYSFTGGFEIAGAGISGYNTVQEYVGTGGIEFAGTAVTAHLPPILEALVEVIQFDSYITTQINLQSDI